MSKVLVDKELVSIVSEKVTETVDVIETVVSPSDGELDDTVGGVVSVLLDVLLLLQEMKVELKRRKKERMMSRFFTWFHISGLEEPNIYHQSVCFTRMWDFTWRVSDSEELVGEINS